MKKFFKNYWWNYWSISDCCSGHIPLLSKVLVDQTNASYARAAGLEKKRLK
jgi:hypothetical protein